MNELRNKFDQHLYEIGSPKLNKVEKLAIDCFIDFLINKEISIVPSEPTVDMVDAALREVRLAKKVRENCIKAWAPHAGKPSSHEPGIVSELRAGIAKGRLT